MLVASLGCLCHRGSLIRGTKTLQPKAPTTQIWPIKPCPSHLSEGAWSRPGHFNKRVLPPASLLIHLYYPYSNATGSIIK